jgi:signal transduction histidine kinase
VTTLLRRLLGPFGSGETYRALLFHVATLALGIAGLVVLIVGWTATIVFAITPLVVPVLIGFGVVLAAIAQAHAALARKLLGAEFPPPAWVVAGSGFWSRAARVLRDRAFWRQQIYLLVAWPISLVVLALLSNAVQLLALPISYRWSNESYGVTIDSFGEALLFVPVGMAVLLVTVHLLGPLTRLSRALAARLLAGGGVPPRVTAEERRARHRRALEINGAAVGAIDLALLVIWALTTRGYFWPIWPILALGLELAIHGWVVHVLDDPEVRRRAGGSQALALQAGISAAVGAYLIGVWAAAGGGYFWPVWALSGLFVALLIHAGVVFRHHQHRIGVLETTRADVVDVQEAELRRIERDLHDGAQARLVALGMSLGLAEQKLQTDPEGARELLVEARRGATEALEDLRDLARGIHPPILTDRGLEAAIAALVARSPVPVALSFDLDERPAGPVEIAAYFVVAEALANATKHAEASRLTVSIRLHENVLDVEVSDDGLGGADPSGAGITGLRRRVEALDGTLQVTSPRGGPTTVRAELPCAL